MGKIKRLFLFWLILTVTGGNVMSDNKPTNKYQQRADDWRIGAITYQVFVDRFAPARDLEAKRHLYPAPKSLRPWDELPKQEAPSNDSILWTHELAFWGGDLQSLAGKIDYIQSLGVDVLYLNPIVKAQSNHKYDAIDLMQIAPEYGTLEDLKTLASQLDKRNIQLVLDGVFNHVGFQSEWFQSALNDPESPYRNWFHFDDAIQNGYVGWWGVANLPELNWDNPDVQEAFLSKNDGIVRQYFNYGIDGWRLDVATELGFEYLRAITDAAEEEKSDALVIGEVWNYPKDWVNSLNAVMNFSTRELMFRFVENKLGGPQFTDQLATQIRDADYEAILRSWLLIDNHDTPRLKTLYPDIQQQRMLQILQMTLPGSPLLYYGVELGMEGGEDPENRAPMRWDLNTNNNPEMAWLKKLIKLREENRALKLGDFLPLTTQSALAFMRVTDRIEDTIAVVVNSSDKAIVETLMLRDPRIMNGDQFRDLLSDDVFPSRSGVMTLEIPAQTAMIIKPDRWLERSKETGHSPYKHID